MDSFTWRASVRTTNTPSAKRPCRRSAEIERSALRILRKDVVVRLRDRVARSAALGIVPLRRHVSGGGGRELVRRGVVLERAVTPTVAVGEALAVLHHEVDVVQLVEHERLTRRALVLLRLPMDLRHLRAIGERL